VAIQGRRLVRFALNDGSAFTPNETPAPEDAYGLSKWEAEQVLLEIASQTGMEVVGKCCKGIKKCPWAGLRKGRHDPDAAAWRSKPLLHPHKWDNFVTCYEARGYYAIPSSLKSSKATLSPSGSWFASGSNLGSRYA
jgi:hypothetical protein